MGYSKRAFIGISWLGFLRTSMKILTLVRISILARIFSPAEFGLFGIATLILGLLEIISETGINVILIQEKGNIHKYISTAWIVSIGRGIFITSIILLLSPFIASFFNAPNVLHLLMLISIVPFVRGFINPSIVFYQKELQFKNEFAFRFVVFLIESVVIVILAIITHSIASIIVGLIIAAIIEVTLSFLVIQPRPLFRFEKKRLWEVVRRGKWVTAAGVFNYLFHNADDIIVGKMLGIIPLGLYQIGYKVAILPITEISDILSRVAFPVFVKIAQDRHRLRKAFFKVFALVSILSMAFGAMLFLFTEQIVQIVLGPKWFAVVPFLKILTIFGVVRGISGSTSALFLAVKKQRYVFIVTFVSFLSLIAIIVPLIGWGGLIGSSVAVLIASIVVVPVMGYFTYKVLYEA